MSVFPCALAKDVMSAACILVSLGRDDRRGPRSTQKKHEDDRRRSRLGVRVTCGVGKRSEDLSYNAQGSEFPAYYRLEFIGHPMPNLPAQIMVL